MTGRRYVALLRGINVGKAKRVSMAELRSIMEGLGYGDVRTLLNSGNVVFSAPEVEPEEAEARIEAAIEAACGFSSRTIVLSAGELAAVVEGNTILHRCEDTSRFLVSVFRAEADAARVAPLLAEEWAPDEMAVGRRAAYLWCAGGLLESRLATAVGKALGERATARNWATMVKLNALANGE